MAGGALAAASSCLQPSPGGWLSWFDSLSEHGVQCVGWFVGDCLIIAWHWGSWSKVERAPDWEAGVLGFAQVTDSVGQASL